MEKTTTTTETAVLGSVSLCSNLMRAPQVFDQYGPSIAGLARDLVIWAAWNGSKDAQLNVRQFAKMFGYSTAFLFKRIEPAQAEELRRSKLGPEFKDRIGYALAKLYLQRLSFAEATPYTTTNEQGLQQDYAGITLIRSLSTRTSRTGTTYSFEMSRSFINNCRKRYQTFSLDTYLQLADGSGKAYSSARKMFIHMCWKRRVWDRARIQKGVFPSHCNFAELVEVAGYNYGHEHRTAHALRTVLEDIALLPGVKMFAEVAKNYETEQYSVTLTKSITPEPHPVDSKK